MTSNTLKVDCTSHCTTPSEPHDPSLVSVKVGCFHVNPATPRGRRKFLLQMLMLCFVPHAALIIQNSTIMAQLMQTLDSALYLNSEVETVLSLGDLILALQDERQEVVDFLFLEPSRRNPNRTTLEMTFAVSDDHFDRVPADVKDHREITLYQLLATHTLMRSIEEVSLSLASFIFYARFKQSRLQERDAIASFQTHRYSAADQLALAAQCLEVEKLELEARILDEITAFFKQTPQIESAPQDVSKYINDSRERLGKLREVQTSLFIFVREAVSWEMWVARRTLLIAALILVLVVLASPILVLLLRHTVYTIQTFTHSIELSTQRLMAEKQKSDMLLSRMLPLPVLKRLRAQRTVPAESFDAVTIFFSDIVGFTTISANSTPMEVINMLNMLYRLFDQKIMQYNVYKVETIGDAYMVVSGLPQRNGNKHASEIADMSLSLMRSLEGATVPHRPHDTLRIRAGVNTGPCVAGVVGTTMPRYCLFGDTINTASRMESTGEAMKIHISHTTKKALDEIGNYEMVSRGIVDVAGKGTMETYWLVDKIGGLQEDSPNCRLHDYGQNLLEMLIGP